MKHSKYSLSLYGFLDRTDDVEKAARDCGFLPPDVTYRQAVVLGNVQCTLPDEFDDEVLPVDSNSTALLFPKVILPEEKLPAVTAALYPLFDEENPHSFEQAFQRTLRQYKVFLDERKRHIAAQFPFFLTKGVSSEEISFMEERVSKAVFSHDSKAVSSAWADTLLFVYGQSFPLGFQKGLFSSFLEEIQEKKRSKQLIAETRPVFYDPEHAENICRQIRDEIACLTKLEDSVKAL